MLLLMGGEELETATTNTQQKGTQHNNYLNVPISLLEIEKLELICKKMTLHIIRKITLHKQ